MSGENILNLLAQQTKAAEETQHGINQSHYTGKYDTHLEEQTKPSYSTFWERGKEYDCTNPRFYKQRNAVIGKNVGEDVDPKMFLRRGEGIRYIVPPIHEDKLMRNPPVDHNRKNAFGGGDGAGNNGSGNQGKNGPGGDGDSQNNGSLDNKSANSPINGSGLSGTWPDGSQNGRGYGAKGDSDEPYKDFISSNIVEVSNMVPRRRKLQPEYATDRKDFGQVPAYLERVKNEVDREKEYVAALENKKGNKDQEIYSKYVYRLTDEERTLLLEKLRKKLNDKTMTLKKIPLSRDSLSISKKKGELQNDIKDLEKAISKIDREAIFVYKDDPVNGEWAKNAAMKEARLHASRASKG